MSPSDASEDLSPPPPAPPPPPLGYGEQRGARKRARAQQTRARHAANRELVAELCRPPATPAQAAQRWDLFYATKPTLFKDRHVLRAAFPELVAARAAADPAAHVPPLARAPPRLAAGCAPSAACDRVLVEAGCGAGNAVFPLLRANGRLFALAFDFSAAAVRLLRASAEYREDRVRAFQADVTLPDSYVPVVRAVRPHGVDFVTAMWTLSALPPAQHRAAAGGLAALLAGGGQLFVRDYGVGDMREARFAQRAQRAHQLPEHLYLRGDGTYAYFFGKDELRRLFEAHGLVCLSCEVEHRVVHNRKTQTTMRRTWVQAKFRKE